MNSTSQNLQPWKKLASNPRFKAAAIGVMILVAIVMMQVSNLNRRAPMCDLLTNCNLRTIDLHKMQIALSKSGLSEFQVKGNTILVPALKQAEYLQAIAEQGALPKELYSGKPAATAVPNPFLSRTQQLAVERDARKRHVQEMVIRLPFVEAAWFEMDTPESATAFRKIQKSAVISIRPVQHQWLLDQHVDTVRQMISGAVSGLDPQQIVVIDLSSGFAHRNADSKTPADRRLDQQRATCARQQMLTGRIQESLTHLPGVAVAVQIEAPFQEVAKRKSVEPSESNASSNSANQVSQVSATYQTPVAPVAGANGQASIDDIPFAKLINPPMERPAALLAASPATSVASARPLVSVTFHVPYELAQRYSVERDTDWQNKLPKKEFGEFGESGLNRLVAGTSGEPQPNEARTLAAVKLEIESIVRPVLEQELATSYSESETQFSFRLLPQSAAAATDSWQSKLKKMAQDNWPSLAVLALGLVLITLVTQTNRKFRQQPLVEATDHPAVLPFSDGSNSGRAGLADTSGPVSHKQRGRELPEKSPASESRLPETNEPTPNEPSFEKSDAESRLAQIIESDPDSAAKVIESWIRDVA